METAGRVCVECYDIIDPLHPSNLYIQHCVIILLDFVIYFIHFLLFLGS